MNTKKNIVHSNDVFLTRVQLLFKLTHVVTTYVKVIAIKKSQMLIVMYVIMKQMDCATIVQINSCCDYICKSHSYQKITNVNSHVCDYETNGFKL